VQRARSTAEARGRIGAGAGPSPSGELSAEDRRLLDAVSGLALRAPEFSAAIGLWDWQRNALVGLLAATVGGALLAPEPTLIVLLAVLAIPFVLVVVLRAAALWHVLGRGPEPALKPLRWGDNELPVYTVLVPLFREARAVPHLIGALSAIDYPTDRLEVLLIVESIDAETQAALAQAGLGRHMRVVIVPDGTPRTRPRALQYALQLARGDYVVVYDAEDRPEPDQLRLALAALRADGERLGCLQARLNVYNARASWVTRGIMAQTPLC